MWSTCVLLIRKRLTMSHPEVVLWGDTAGFLAFCYRPSGPCMKTVRAVFRSLVLSRAFSRWILDSTKATLCLLLFFFMDRILRRRVCLTWWPQVYFSAFCRRCGFVGLLGYGTSARRLKMLRIIISESKASQRFSAEKWWVARSRWVGGGYFVHAREFKGLTVMF